MRARAHLGEQYLVAYDEHLDAEDTVSAERIGHLAGDMLCLPERRFAHRLRLPRLTVVAVDLVVANGLQEERTPGVAHGEQRDFVVKRHKALNDDTTRSGTASLLADGPCPLDVGGVAYRGLAVSRRRHDRLHQTGQTDLLDGGEVLLVRVGKGIARGGQPQLLGGKAAYRLTIHGQESDVGGRDDSIALLLQLHKGGSGYRLDLRNDERWTFLLHHLTERGAVQHIENMAAVRHLHGGRIRILVASNDFNAEALQLDGNLFAEFARAEQQRTGGGVCEGSSEGHLNYELRIRNYELYVFS